MYKMSYNYIFFIYYYQFKGWSYFIGIGNNNYN